MQSLLIKKIFDYSLITALFISGGIIYWVDSELETAQGTHTKVIDPKQFENPIEKIAIKNVNVLSPDTSQMLAKQLVLIEGNKITFIGKDIVLPTDTLIIDASNKYLIPSLTDSHVHLRNSPNDLLLYLAAGVTQVYEMSGTQHHLDWRKEIKNGRLGSRIFVATEKFESSTYENNMGLLDKPYLTWARDIYLNWTRTYINITDTRKVSFKVEQAVMDGYNAIKLGGRMKANMHQAISAAAKKNKIVLWGHISNDNRLESLWNSKQAEVAHIEEITKAFFKEFKNIDYQNKQSIKDFLEFVKIRSDDVAKKIVKKGISVSSTIWLMESVTNQKFNLAETLKSIELKYANSGVVEGNIFSRGWLEGNNSYQLSDVEMSSPQKLKQTKEFWAIYVKAIHIMTKSLAKHNALIMAGTDANTAATVPGFSLLDELISLSKAGLTNAQTLASATSIPNQVIKTNAGKIAKNYDANLILLNKNPLEDMKHIKSIETVFYNGHMLNRNILDKILGAIEKANDDSRNRSIADYR